MAWSTFVGTVDRLGFPLPELLARGDHRHRARGRDLPRPRPPDAALGRPGHRPDLLIVFKVKWDVGLIGPPGRGGGFELDLLFAVTAAALLIAGPGLLALDHLLGLEANPTPLRPPPDRRRSASGPDT